MKRLHLLKDFGSITCLKCDAFILNMNAATILEKDWDKSEFNCSVVPPREGKSLKFAKGGDH